MKAVIQGALRLRRSRGTLRGYVLGAAVIAAALMLRAVLAPIVTIPYATLFPAVLITGVFAGTRAGVVLTFLGAAIATILWSPTHDAPTIALNLGLFLLNAGVLLFAAHVLNETLDALTKERDHSRHLFNELQHRMANNLQIAGSIVRLSTRQVQADPSRALGVLSSVGQRFETLGRIHRLLYKAKPANVDLVESLSALSREVLSSVDGMHHRCEVGGAHLQLDQVKQLEVSLVIVELILNSVKYGFITGDKGLITIDVALEGDACSIRYADNGCGMSSADNNGHGGLGTAIIQSFVHQLGGSGEFESSSSGTAFRFKFPVDAPAT